MSNHKDELKDFDNFEEAATYVHALKVPDGGWGIYSIEVWYDGDRPEGQKPWASCVCFKRPEVEGG
jgi:hypothetical protein